MDISSDKPAKSYTRKLRIAKKGKPKKRNLISSDSSTK